MIAVLVYNEWSYDVCIDEAKNFKTSSTEQKREIENLAQKEWTKWKENNIFVTWLNIMKRIEKK